MLDPYTLCSVYIELFFYDIKLGPATAFFYQKEGRTWLVSNWHVFSGRNTYSGQPNHAHGSTPNCFNVLLRVSGDILRWGSFNIKLEDQKQNCLWRQHRLGQDIDIAVMPVDVPHNVELDVLPSANNAADMVISISKDVFIVGFPLGLRMQDALPIWKRGSVASEPHVKIYDTKSVLGHLPAFLVDSTTREGMSGSPVYYRAASYPTSNGFIMSSNFQTKFLGIYSGRYGSGDELEAQLGRVWHHEVIDEVILNGVPGKFEVR